MKELIIIALLCLSVLLAGCRTVSTESNPNQDKELEVLAAFAKECPYEDNAREPRLPPENVNHVLQSFRKENRRDHFPFLLEYGLRVYWKNLQNTQLARELPLKNNLMLSELIRLAEIPKYTTAHEAGWLNRQFHGQFDATGYSSFQIYIWLKEQQCVDRQDYPNIKRLSELEKVIDASSLNGVGGGGVCHYGCR